MIEEYSAFRAECLGAVLYRYFFVECMALVADDICIKFIFAIQFNLHGRKDTINNLLLTSHNV